MHEGHRWCSFLDADFLFYRDPLPFRYRIEPTFPGMDIEKLEWLIAASA